jgi:Arc/MetJ-type ribon-helix-helix transcriptional regulator
MPQPECNRTPAVGADGPLTTSSLLTEQVSLVGPWYSAGMTTKLAVSLPDELAEQARQAVREGRAASVSAYIAGAMAQSARTRSIAGLVADMRAEDGQPSEEDYAWARRALGVE